MAFNLFNPSTWFGTRPVTNQKQSVRLSPTQVLSVRKQVGQIEDMVSGKTAIPPRQSSFDWGKVLSGAKDIVTTGLDVWKGIAEIKYKKPDGSADAQRSAGVSIPPIILLTGGASPQPQINIVPQKEVAQQQPHSTVSDENSGAVVLDASGLVPSPSSSPSLSRPAEAQSINQNKIWLIIAGLILLVVFGIVLLRKR